jgi:hypothetical protein
MLPAHWPLLISHLVGIASVSETLTYYAFPDMTGVPAGGANTPRPGGQSMVPACIMNGGHRLGMARVDADHREAEPLELRPKPCRRRSSLKADSYYVRRF